MSSSGKHFEYELIVSFEETNVVGNVYFANYFVWQGKCREAFLAEFAPQVIQDFKNGHGMITKDAGCEFFHEAFAFDEVVIRMSLGRLSHTVITMTFDYVKRNGGVETLLAKGQQSVIWSNPDRRVGMLPDYLYDAVKQFTIPTGSVVA